MQPRGEGTGYRAPGVSALERSVRFAADPQPLPWRVYAA